MLFKIKIDQIKCEWSGHEMPLNLSYCISYVNGNRYKKLLEKRIQQTDLKKYSDFLVPTYKPKHK